MDALVLLTGVSKRYDSDGSSAVAHVSREVARGESVAIMGPSGSGKTTLLNLNASGQTLIFLTHNPDLAARYARRVIEVVDGRVASDASVTGARR